MLRRSAAIILTLILLICAAPSLAAETSMAYLTPGVFTIDGMYTQEGMNAPYSKGYEPVVSDGSLNVVLPLSASEKVDGDVIYCGLNLGVAGLSPFVFKNYDSIAVRPKSESDDGTYVAVFDLPLREDRENGVYPLGVSIRYRSDGKEAVQQFRIDFTINDAAQPEPTADNAPQDPGYDPGYDPGGYEPVDYDPGYGGAAEIPSTGGGGEAPNPSGEGAPSEPKVILQEVVTAPSPCSAGSAFTTTCTLKNTSKKTAVRNMTVTYKSQTADLIPNSGVTTSYIESIGPDGTAQFAFSMMATETAASGAQKIDLAISYEGADGAAYTASDEITVLIQQKIRLEHDQPSFPTQVYAGDTISASLNLYNKGKGTLYNVAVSLDVPGVVPESSAFLGNMESGSAKTADIYASVEAEDTGDITEADAEEAMAGAVNAPMKAVAVAVDDVAVPDTGGGAVVTEDEAVSGNFIVSYEDEFGNSYEELVPVSTEIMSAEMFDPGGMDPGLTYPSEEQDADGIPWWVWVLVAGGGAGAVTAGVRSRKKKRARELESESADDDDLY